MPALSKILWNLGDHGPSLFVAFHHLFVAMWWSWPSASTGAAAVPPVARAVMATALGASATVTASPDTATSPTSPTAARLMPARPPASAAAWAEPGSVGTLVAKPAAVLPT